MHLFVARLNIIHAGFLKCVVLVGVLKIEWRELGFFPFLIYPFKNRLPIGGLSRDLLKSHELLKSPGGFKNLLSKMVILIIS